VTWLSFWGFGGVGSVNRCMFVTCGNDPLTHLKRGRIFYTSLSRNVYLLFLCHQIYIFFSFIPHLDTWNYSPLPPYDNDLREAGLRCLAVSLSLHNPGFSRRQFHVGLVVDELQWDEFLSENFRHFSRLCHSTMTPHAFFQEYLVIIWLWGFFFDITEQNNIVIILSNPLESVLE